VRTPGSGRDAADRTAAERGRIAGDVDEEVRFHLERKVEKLIASGMSEEDARREAFRRFGDVERIKEQMTTMTRRREARRRNAEAADGIRQDVAYALRQLVRSPGFTAVTVLTLTLGIGATTAIFSVVDGILFRPLPFEEPEELVAVWSDYTRRGGPVDEWPNFPNLWGLRAQSATLEAVGIVGGSSGTLTGIDGPAEFIGGAAVSHDLLARVLRAGPALGRGFTPEEDRPGAPGTILLSHGLWARAFGEDPAVVDRTITLNGQQFTVIGVMPRDFRPPPIVDGEYWIPLRMDMSQHACGIGGACLRSIARLAQGATLESASAEAAQIAAHQEAEAPDANAGVTWNLEPLQADLVADARVGLLVTLGAAVFVLLIACVNQASLLLARGTNRRGELAVRSAIGAGRGRIVSQLLVESMVLALAGGLVGVAFAYVLTDVLVSLAPPGTPRIDEVAVDGRVLAFAAAATLLSGLLFGTVPALRSAGGKLHDSLREGGRGDPHAAGVRLRQVLVAAQVALALVLLTGSGLLVRSFQKLRDVELGFRPEGLLTFRINLPAARYDAGEPIVAFQRELEEKLAAIPGVEAVAMTSSLPLAGFDSDRGFTIEGRAVPPPEQAQAVWYQAVSPGLLGTIGTLVLRGRGILAGDATDGPRVVVINEAFGRRWFPGEDPLGRRLNFDDPAAPVWWEIVGVARDVKHFSVRDEARASLYVPFTQMRPRTQFWVVRSERDIAALTADVRNVIASVDRELAAGQIMPLGELVRGALAPERFVTMLLTLFAAVALTLAVVGLYGVVSYNVNTRLREMGVRLALGASGALVAALVVRRSLVVVGVGLLAGVVGSIGLTRLLRGLLFGVEPGDLLTHAAAVALLSGAAVAASLLPARRAASVDPSEVLREE
jgi:predicted permease